MNKKVVVTLEIEGLRGYVRLGTVVMNEHFARSLAELLEAPRAKALLSANPGVAAKVRMRPLVRVWR